MTPERWKKLDDLFHEALELQGEARAAHLTKVCGGDEQLRVEAEKLLAAHEREGSFLDSLILAEGAALPDGGDESLVGQSIGHYQVISLLGRGGMGEVYLAEDSRLERKVALKVLPAAFTQNSDRVRRFEREAKAASALNHPNILTIHEIGEASTEVGGAHYIVSEFVSGETLRALIERGRLDINEAIAIAEQVASALGVAHQAGIIHRDIKPENVMVRPDGLVKVLDFGLAKLTEMKTPPIDSQTPATGKLSTEPGVVMGTASYMSPEQARGQKVDARTDIFSLGAMLYEMIAGRRPFEGATTSDVIAALLTTEPPTLKSLTPQVPTGLEGIIKKCLAKGREARYQSATELAAELKAVQAGSHAAGAAALHRKLGRALSFLALPRYSRAGILGACMLLLFGGALGWREFSKFRNAADESRRIVPAIQLSRFTASGNIVTATLSPDGKYVATALEEGGLQSLWLKQVAANASGVRLTALAPVEYWGLTFSHDGNFIYYLSWVRNQSDAELYRLPVLGGTPHRLPIKQLDTPVSFAPAGDRFAYVTPSPRKRESYVKVAQLDDEVGEILVARPDPGFIAVYPGGPAWSPNGQFIAYAASGRTEDDRRSMHVFAVNVADKVERQLGKQGWAEMGRVAWLNDGSGLVLAAQEDLAGPRQLWFVAWPDGAARKLTNDLHDYDGVSLSADGQTLAAVQRQEAFSIAVAPRASPSQANDIYTEVSRGYERFAWTPDQRLLYSSRISGNWDIWLMNRDGSGQRQLTVDPHSDTLPAISSDGRHVYFASDRAGTSNIWRMEMDGGDVTRLTNGTNEFFPEVTPDGRWLIYQQGPVENEISVWRVLQAGGEPARVHEQTMAVSITKRPAVSPDGRWLAYVALDEREWGVTLRALGGSGADKRFSFPSIIGKHDVRWTPDSQALAYIVQENGVANLWLQPLSGAPPRQLTRFKTGRFSTFAWSPDGQWLAYLRPTAMRDVVLLRDFR